jgi:hypothetical protein
MAEKKLCIFPKNSLCKHEGHNAYKCSVCGLYVYANDRKKAPLRYCGDNK